MSSKNIIDESIGFINSGIDNVNDTYEEFIRKRAIEEVNKNLQDKGIDLELIDDVDYEVMVSDKCKDIDNKYKNRALAVSLGLLGLSLF
ncbi:MAG: hypothetical protein RBQ81_08410 [Arcobacteraceae bacterium]|nr:hypothetical protein [Arcobacteraceae bacterium]